MAAQSMKCIAPAGSCSCSARAARSAAGESVRFIQLGRFPKPRRGLFFQGGAVGTTFDAQARQPRPSSSSSTR